MRGNYHDIGTLPEPGDIVWCKWPQREDKGMPGPSVRPVLVRETELREFADGTQFGMILVSYGTGERIDNIARQRDLVIEANEFRARSEERRVGKSGELGGSKRHKKQ